MPDGVARVWREVVAAYGDGVEAICGPDLEGYCGQVARLRDAQERLARDGLIVSDPKGNPIPHPALAIEKVAQDEIRKWGSQFKPRRRRG
ncbi:MAG: P27 family phage terminase small subunit [Veillonellaceae bacterium]|nr:P27 family phage terminase small subunit [Veillonellaceae bacterium]